MSVDSRFTRALLDDEAVAAARVLTDLAGRPDALVVLGSGLADALDEAWGVPAATVSLGEIQEALALTTRPQPTSEPTTREATAPQFTEP